MRLLAFSALIAWSAVAASAQPVIGAKSGVISLVEGKAYLGDKLLEMQAAQFPDVKENVTFRTEEGRAEVLLTPGVVLRLGENSSFKMITNRLIDTRLDLLTGSAVLTAIEMVKDNNVTLLVKESSITFTKAGVYHFDVEPARLKVFAGTAEVKLGGETLNVAGGKMITLSGALAVAEKFDVKDTDSLDHWSRRRDELMANSNISAANQARKSSSGMSDPCYGYGGYGNNRGMIRNLGNWGYNPYYGLVTYIPCSGSVYSPYGYRYWSPMAVYRAYFAPRPVYSPPSYGGGGNPGYSTMGGTSGGYSGVVASSGSSGSSSAPAAASSGSSTASSAASSSAGQSSGGGGGRGH